MHTGWWGCGAYGGNRTLMAMLQVLADQLANLDQLVFHAGKSNGIGEFQLARQLLAEQLELTTSDELSKLLHRVE